MAAKSPTKTIFNLPEINTACAEALAHGEGLDAVFAVATTARPGPNGTKYMDLTAKVPGKQGRLVVRLVKEKHVGQIPPLDESEVSRVNAVRGDKFGVLKARDRHPTIGIQKYSAKVETDDNGKVKGELPDEDQKSPYFRMVEYLDTFLYNTMQERIKSGAIAEYDSRRENYAEGCVVVPAIKIAPTFQGRVSATAKINANSLLANPIARVNMKFDTKTGMSKKTEFYDFTKAFTDPGTGKRNFEVLKFDGNPVTAHNVHMISSHSLISGIVNLNAVCASNMGLSIPTDTEVLVIEPPTAHSVDVDDVFEEGFDFGDEPPAPAGGLPEREKPPVAGGSNASKAEVPDATVPDATVPEDDLDSLVQDLAIDE